jgi:hypothetical protein
LGLYFSEFGGVQDLAVGNPISGVSATTGDSGLMVAFSSTPEPSPWGVVSQTIKGMAQQRSLSLGKKIAIRSKPGTSTGSAVDFG